MQRLLLLISIQTCLQTMAPAIIDQFKQYGEIESIAVTIRFKNQTDVISILNEKSHDVKDHLLKIESSCPAPVTLPITKKYKRVHSTETHILDLDDFCLVRIFKHYLGFKDLRNISRTCTRFNQLSTYVFSTKYNGRYQIYLLSPMQKYKKDIEDFGAAIKRLDISWCNGAHPKYIKNIMELTTKYCGKNLKELFLHSYVDTEQDCDLMMMSAMMNFSNLKHLYLEYDCSKSNMSSGRMMPCFETYNHCRTEEIAQLLSNSRISKLSKLSISCTHRKCEDALSSQFKSNLSKFKLLRELYIAGGIQIPLIKFIGKIGTPIKILTIGCSQDTDIIVRSISKLESLEVLRVIDFKNFNEKHLSELAKKLKSLSEFHINLYVDEKDAMDEESSPSQEENENKCQIIPIEDPLHRDRKDSDSDSVDENSNYYSNKENVREIDSDAEDEKSSDEEEGEEDEIDDEDLSEENKEGEDDNNNDEDLSTEEAQTHAQRSKRPLKFNGVMHMLEHAQQLKKFVIDFDVKKPSFAKITIDVYEKILKLVKNRKEKVKLSLVMPYVNLSQIDAETLQRNQEWLEFFIDPNLKYKIRTQYH